MSRNRSWGIAAKGEEKRDDLGYLPVFVYIVSPGYLKAMGMRLMEGRDISWEDVSNNRSVVIINETVARKLWPGQDPIGRTALADGTEPQVIGVIADVRESGAEDNAGAQMYLPATKQFGPEGSNLVVRSKLPPTAVATSVMGTLRQINPGQPATEFKDWSTARRLQGASLCCWSEPLLVWDSFWLRWESMVLSHIPLRARGRKSAYAWLLVRPKRGCNSM
jgi:hypothetical protein